MPKVSCERAGSVLSSVTGGRYLRDCNDASHGAPAIT
jgi:hypothetical protein